MTDAKGFDDLVATTRVPLADLADKVIAAQGNAAAISAAIDAAAEGMARCYWDGMLHWIGFGRRMAIDAAGTKGLPS